MILMDFIELLFNLCICINAVMFLPQAYKIYQNKTPSGVSLVTYSCLLFVQFTFTLHFLMLNNYIAALSMFIGAIACLCILGFAINKTKFSTAINDIPLSDIIDQLPCSIYWRDKEANYYGMNKACVKTLGINQEENLHKNLYEIFPKEIADRVTLFDNEVMRSEEQIVKREYGPIRNDGCQTVFISAKKQLKDESGNCIGLIGVSFDYTDIDNELRKKVELQDRILASMPGYVYWLDKNAQYEGCNNNYANSLGLNDRNEIKDKSASFMPDIVEPDIIESSNKKVLYERIKLTAEEKSLRNDGSIATILSHKAPIFDKSNNVIGMVSNSLDVSIYKEKRQSLEKDLEDANLASNIKYDFINNMTYDIRTPISGIISMTNALIEKVDNKDPVIKESGGKIVQAGTKLLDVINEIVKITEPGTGKLALQQQEVNFRTLIGNVIDVSIPAAYSKNINIDLDFDNNIPDVLLTDPIRCHRILFQLVCNAIKFTNKGEIKISAFLSEQESKRYIIKIAVKDTGIGIAKNDQSSLFDLPKEKLAKGKKTHGLKVVKGFVDDLNGEIYVNSNLGSGAEFICYIPCKEVAGHSIVDIITNEKPSFAPKKEINYKRRDILRSLQASILIVDDDHLSQMATKLLLNNFGCQVTIASNGEEAMKYIKKGRFDMVFMDIGLPDISGFKVIDSIRSSLDNVNNNLPIVILTAHNDLSSFNDVSDFIADIHTKPVSNELCESILAKYLLKKLEGESIVDMESS